MKTTERHQRDALDDLSISIISKSERLQSRMNPRIRTLKAQNTPVSNQWAAMLEADLEIVREMADTARRCNARRYGGMA